MPETTPYQPRRRAGQHFADVRGLRYHVHSWGSATLASAERPPLVLLHGWMDVAASFQFVVDALEDTAQAGRWIVAPDWRGFGLTDAPPTDSYWFPDYLGDLDVLLGVLGIEGTIDLVGHSMGGNVAMLYAGVRPARIRKLVNLEGFSMPATQPEQAPKRLVQWLDQLTTPQTLRTYDSVDGVTARLLKNNPLLTPDKAAWLAPHWSRQAADGQWHVLGDPAHKRANPVLSRRDETLACWKRITAPVLWAEGDRTEVTKFWGDRYPRSDFEERLAVVPDVRRVLLAPCGHMLHHDQPRALAQHIAAFLG